MRAREFLLVEYKRDITARTYGKTLASVARKDRTIPQGFRSTDISDEEIAGAILGMLEDADPTPNKQYTPWLAKMYVNGGGIYPIEDIKSTAIQFLTKFHKLKSRNKIPSPRNDIMRYDDLGDFYSVVDEYPDPDEKPLTDKGEAKEVYSDANVRVIEPEDQAAACYYGQGTRWCTAATKGENYFDQYANAAPLFIVIPKKPAYPGEKYQLWFDYSIGDDRITSDADFDEAWHYYGEDYVIDYQQYGQFMNEKDEDVGLKAIAKRFGPSFSGMLHAIEQQNPKIKYAINKNLEDAGIK